MLALQAGYAQVTSKVHNDNCHMGVERTKELVSNVLPYVTY